MLFEVLKRFLLLFTCASLLTSCGGGKADDPELRSINDIYTDIPNYIIQLSSPLANQLFNSQSSATFDITGSCAEIGKISIKLNTIEQQQVDCISSSFTSTLLLSSLSEGYNTITANYLVSTDTAVVAVLKDTNAPTLVISPNQINQSNEGNYIIQGTCSENGSVIHGNLEGIPFSTTCLGTSFTSSPIDLSFLVDNTYSAQATISDSNGNTSSLITQSIIKDTSVTLPSLSFSNPENGHGNNGSVDIRISNIAASDDIFVYTDSSCSGALLTSETSAATSHIINFLTPSEGSYYYYFTVPSQSGATCLGPLVYQEDLTDPLDVATITMSSPSHGETSSDATPFFSGTIDSSENGSQVYIYKDNTCATTEIGSSTVQQASFSIGASLALDGSDQGFNEFFIKVIDRAGNVGSCQSTGLSYTLSNTGLASQPKLAMIGVDAPSKLISLEDDNLITWTKKADPSNPITFGPLSKGDVIYIEDPLDTLDKVDAGDIIESTGATYVVSQGFGTAPWATEAYSGKVFTSYQYRYGNYSKIYVTSLVADSFVQIKQDTDGDGDLDTIAYATVPKNQVIEFTPSIIDGRSFQIVSDYDINAYYVSSSTSGATYDKDARVLTPAATDLVGFSWFITSIENNTSVTAHRHQAGSNFSEVDLDINEVFDVGRTLKSNLIDYATRVLSDKPVSMLQIADQDGTNASPSLPVSMLATDYGIPADADYIGIIAPISGNYYYTIPGNPEVGPIALTPPGNTDPNAPYAAQFSNGGNVPAGTLIRCDTPCFMIYDDEELGDEDETLMMGFSP